MEELYVLNDQASNISDPHGYFRDIGRRLQLNYSSATKRSFLNECIHQIHIMNGNTMPMISIPLEYNKTVIWHKLNNLMRPSTMTRHQILVQRVKRRLFRESKKRLRKCQKTKLNKSKLSEGVYFKASRYILGIRRIPRNYLDQARENVRNDFRQKRKRRFTEDPEDEAELIKSPVRFNTNEGLFEVSQQVIKEVCQYHGNMARYYPQQDRTMDEQVKRQRNTYACRVSRRAQKLEEMLIEQQYRKLSMANDRFLEASVRSFLYVKTLMRLMVAQPDERNLYI